VPSAGWRSRRFRRAGSPAGDAVSNAAAWSVRVALAAVTLGIARAPIEALIELAAAKQPMGSAVLLRDRPSAQGCHRSRRSAGSRRAGSRFWRDPRAMGGVAAGAQPTIQARTSIRLACTYCGEACAIAVDLVHGAAGGSALFETGRVARCFRDIHAATQRID
jgi:hypothetical protein